MIASFIARQLDHRYRVLQRSLTLGLTDELAWRPLGARPPIGWHAAHIAEAIASTAQAVALGPNAPSTALPAGVQASAVRQPSGGTAIETSYPPMGLGALIQELNRLSSIQLSALKSLTDDDLERPPLVEVHEAFSSTLTSRMVFLEGHLFHVSYHLGAIGVLRAEWGLEA